MKQLLVSVLVAMMFMASGAAQAAMVSLDINYPFSYSGNAPTGSINAIFTDVIGGVQLKIVNNLSLGENIDEIYLNINPGIESTPLAFTLTSNLGGIETAAVLQENNHTCADGGGYYDIKLSYSPNDKDFLPGISQTYLISGTGISVYDFVNFPSIKHGNNGTWLAAAHVQGSGTNAGSSAWLGASTVPVPPTVWLLGSGLLGLIGFKRKIRG